jgi:hypothetical protein
MEEIGNPYKMMIRKPQEKSCRDSQAQQNNDIKTVSRETGCEGMNYIKLPPQRAQ